MEEVRRKISRNFLDVSDIIRTFTAGIEKTQTNGPEASNTVV